MSFGSGTGFGGFGNTNQQQSSGGFGGFGGSTTGNTGFGSTNTGFGATNTAGSSLFGGSTTGTTGFGAGGFGATNNNTNNASPFGAAKPAFGASTTTTGGGLFGGNNTSTSGTGFGGGFGGGTAAAAPAFGSPASTGTGMFGSAAAKPGFGAPAAGTSLFGSGTNNTAGGFGATNTGTSGFGGGGFGTSAQQTPQNNGTAATPFAAHVEKDAASSTNSHYQSITFQQPYQGFSFEELRLADYNAGRRYGNSNGQPGAFGTNTGFGGFGGTQPAATGTTGFGAANTTGTSLFGGNNANNTNATQSPFGQSSAPATGFGNTNSGGLFGTPKPATGSLFGSQPAASTGTTGGNIFGTGNTATSTAGTGFGGGFGSGTATAAPGTSLFGNAAQPSKPFGNTGFGSTGTTGGFGSGTTGTTGTTGGFGQTGTSTGGGLFGGNQQPATGGGLFGSNNTQQPQQQNTGTGLFNSGGGFGQNNTQNQTSGTGGGIFNAFGQNNQQNQQKPAGLSFGGSTGIGGGGLFGSANNQQQQQQPAAGSNSFGQPNNQQQNTGGGLFGPQKPSTGGLFGPTQGSGSTGASLFGGQNNQQQNTGGGLFGGNNQQQNTGGGLFGGNNNNNPGQKPSLFGNSLGGGLGNSTNNNGGGSLFGGNSGQQPGILGQSMNQQQGQNQLAATLLSNPYGNDQLFQNLGTPSAPVGPLATPLAGAQKSTKKPTPLPQFKINPTASLRLITTPQKRSNGYGFSYQTYGTPGSAQSFTSNGLGSSLLQSGGLSRSLGKSFSTNNLRGNLSPEGDNSSVLAPGAFTPNSRPYAGGSIRRLKIDRNLRTDLFGDGSASEPSSLNKKRVSFSKDTGKASASNGPSAIPNGTPSNALVRTEPEGTDDTESSALPPARSTANGTRSNGTPLRQEINGNGLDMVPENETAPATARSVANDLPRSHTDQTPGTYWMSPSLKELRNMSREQLKKVHGFKVGRNGIGRIEFDDVDLTTVPLDDICDDIVKLNHRSATVYATDADTPTPGKGLNVPSTIILENSWPRAYAGKVPVHERKGPRFDKHLERLKRVENTEFISYDPETGIWIFRVQHFTTYGLDDDEEEDDADFTMETEQQDPTPKANVALTHQDEASDMSAEESTPDDTFDFKKGPSKSLPGGFDGGQSIYADEDMADETDAQDDNSSFLEQRGMSMLEDPFRSSGSGSAAALAVQADERPMDEAVPEQDMAGSFPEPEPQNNFSASLMPKSILKNSTLFGPGTPKKNLALTGDWAEQLQRTVSPKKQDRQALRERQASVMGAGATSNAPFAASIAGKAFHTTMDIMNSLWEPTASTSGNPLKNLAGGKGFEWPYAKRPKIDDAFTDMNESDRAFHSSFKPSWTTNNTLVYAIPGSAPSVSGNMAEAKRSIVSEGKDVRFARFAPEIPTVSALQVQMAQIVVSEVDGIPAAQTAQDLSFAALADSVTQTTVQGKHERSVWKLASILFDPLAISCSTLMQGLAEHEVAKLEHRIRRDALSQYWSELVREDAATAARDAATAEEKAFAFLTGNNIEEACAALVDGRDLRLATIIAQLPGNSIMREMIKKQMDAWRSQNILSEMPEPIRALYELTAGNLCISEGKAGASEDRAPTFNISSQFSLDWRRSFGLRLWFGDNKTDSLAEAVHAYADDVASGKETARPRPFFTEQSLSTTWKDMDSEAREDTFFGLLKLYARKPTVADVAAIMDFLAPASISGNPLDARLAWQLSILLRSKGIISPADVTDETLDTLGLSLATQLEANNELSEALKVLLHLTRSVERETLIRSMLYRRAPDFFAASDSNSLPTRLTDEVKIPSAWLWHARALYARSVEEDHVGEATYLLRAGAYNESHNVLCRIVGPQAVISQDYDRLRELFGSFDGLSADVKIDGWDIGGLVYFQYIHLLDLEGRYGEQQMKEKKVVLERMAKLLPRMLAVRHRGRVDLEERVAVGLMSSTVKAESEKFGREEQIGFAKGKLDALPTAGDGYAKQGLELSATFYKAIAT